MSFTDKEITEYTEAIERIIWSKRRPPLHLRDKVREGQRIEGNTVELFLCRPHFMDTNRWIEESIAKVKYVKSRKVWKVYWKRADLKWHLYDPKREVRSFEAFLRLMDEDAYSCFWG